MERGSILQYHFWVLNPYLDLTRDSKSSHRYSNEVYYKFKDSDRRTPVRDSCGEEVYNRQESTGASESDRNNGVEMA
ncbi:hypothetical protein SCP_0400940 [Sparassis crispa]|uniref:Uncharacterized protein n=1 Tax=Sparassis crispa TaxID=139825 RepID=A0A401GHX1_9APHY|nr:hypothetical protein SCP_0400940 [Sparassis crispa]GBE81723.1 hypothetical protein SCP_0400940 [Sparassis crispa]